MVKDSNLRSQCRFFFFYLKKSFRMDEGSPWRCLRTGSSKWMWWTETRTSGCPSPVEPWSVSFIYTTTVVDYIFLSCIKSRITINYSLFILQCVYRVLLVRVTFIKSWIIFALWKTQSTCGRFVGELLKVHRNEKFFCSGFEFCTFLFWCCLDIKIL